MNYDNQNTRSEVSTDMTIDGNLETTGAVAILGTVNGNVSAAKLVLEISGKIIGNVKADNAELLGNQQGEVRAQSLTIRAGAVLKGKVLCEKLVVESGAVISGKFEVGAR
jgi:cytoskeletal protein CcmA (bactofilin family)